MKVILELNALEFAAAIEDGTMAALCVSCVSVEGLPSTEVEETPAPAPAPVKKDPEDILTRCKEITAQKLSAGKRAGVSKLLGRYDAKKVSDIPEEKLEEYLAEIEAL